MQHTEGQNDSAMAEARTAPSCARLCVLAPGEPAHALAAHGTVLGREAGDLVFEDASMSRRHASILSRTARWVLVDHQSRNGCFVDGRAIEPGAEAPLVDGSVVRLGNTLAVFHLGAGEPAGAPAGVDESFFPGRSAVAAGVRRRLRATAAVTGHVLLLGETGTGKERAARAFAGPDDSRPFVPLNCAELTRELARSELFGHARGAFSGAATAKPGLVGLADGGVLFLDEIGELPLDVQGDLLRFLEDGSFRPVGSHELRHSRARVVAATNVELDAQVSKGLFRRDLLARLRASNAPIELPPLRDRREDILAWARHFAAEAGSQAQAREYSAGALECLLLHAWPENLRELRGLVRSLVLGERGGPVTPDELPARLRLHRQSLRAVAAGELLAAPVGEPPADPTREEIERTLAQHEGRVRAAALALAIDRRKLYRLCERLGIDIDCHRRRTEQEEG